METEYLCVSTFLGLKSCDELSRRCRKSGGLIDEEKGKPQSRLATRFHTDEQSAWEKALKIDE